MPVNFVKLIAKVSEKYSSLSDKAAVFNVEKVDELMAVNWWCSIENAKGRPGFYPEYNLKAGVTETIKLYKANKWL